MPSLLRLRGHTYYARISVPRTLTNLLGDKLELSLQTRDLRVAEQKKHAAVAHMKARIDAARKGDLDYPKFRIVRRSSNADEYQAALREAYESGDQQQVALVLDAAGDSALAISAEDGVEDVEGVEPSSNAKDFHVRATGTLN